MFSNLLDDVLSGTTLDGEIDVTADCSGYDLYPEPGEEFGDFVPDPSPYDFPSPITGDFFPTEVETPFIADDGEDLNVFSPTFGCTRK
ncbi:MAG: hypothetical protein IKY27_08775 [Bacteroidales bacterium]|nr:hypothetical protein [Bacteroidales bacterium]